MTSSRLRFFVPLVRHPLIWLALASLVLTFYLSTLPPDAVRAMQDSSPVTTDTPAPTFTPIPDTATFTPTFTATPTAPEATPPATATFPATAPPPIETATPSGLETILPPGLETPVETPTVAVRPSDTPSPPVILVTATFPPVLAPTETLTATFAITQTGGAPPPTQDADALVELIDAFVLYSAYFLLGCGVIVFVALAIGFFYLNRRTRPPD